jgi:hypothetical protein
MGSYMKKFGFSALAAADLIVDATYEGDSNSKNIGGEPLGPLTGTGNSGGFRWCGPISNPKLVVLYSTMEELNWPDAIDEEAGLFTYYGDNRKPGFELHDRKAGRGGNQILRRSFELAHSDENARREVPPFLVFCRAARGRDAIFKGLAVPGAAHLDQASDLVAIWKSEDSKRFQNYRAVFTILNTAVVPRAWIAELQAGRTLGRNCPTAWRRWIDTGKPTPLKAEKILRTRNAAQQLGTERERAIAAAVYFYFKKHPTTFEYFAADVVRLMDANVVALDVTRPSRDGGRDGVGVYRIGMANNYVTVDFAMEAKCYEPRAGLGVKIVSRLISRLRHRQFGILVTTTYLADQAYSEIIEDQHPILICAGGDISSLMIEKLGLDSPQNVTAWLEKTYKLPEIVDPQA